ncbi:MAG TPA: GlsB/YeaQ/YmgE family stress response membrane protein [Aggregatilineales bacterium]|nr:GlsB/YeaQ/YmgE family stress response membrane protein [Aggregatilineales bacterium]
MRFQQVQTITVSFVPEYIITWLIVGLVAGFLASLFVRGSRSSATASIITGLIGAAVGGFLWNIFGLGVPSFLAGGFTVRWIDIVVAFLGAVLVLVIFNNLRERIR